MSRQLATIQQITETRPIEGADRIKHARVLGWWVVVGSEVDEADCGVFFEIDSVLPRAAWSEFLFKKPEEETYRLRTVKLRGAVSQGLFVPLDKFMDWQQGYNPVKRYERGHDVTEQLGVTLYEPPQANFFGGCQSKPENLRPFFYNVPRTDETRLQSVPHVLEELTYQLWEATLKMDGQSVTALWDVVEGRVRTASRNYEVVGDWKFTEWAAAHELSRKLAQYGGYAFQGEFIGENINGNRHRLEGVDWYVFNIFNTLTGRRIDNVSLRYICGTLGLKTPPVVANRSTHPDLPLTVEGFTELAKQQRYEGGYPAEGIVVRWDGDYSPALRGFPSFKVISPDYLLKIGE